MTVLCSVIKHTEAHGNGYKAHGFFICFMIKNPLNSLHITF